MREQCEKTIFSQQGERHIRQPSFRAITLSERDDRAFLEESRQIRYFLYFLF